ncbi:helix-hairpin-helix domain-containing protein [Catenuloplanes sp. NPDC051500]|uniref:helix-hairpin-helix domain-containing protein n=1 Tax=Catenuloplanes sp. NPDC051500 TaxID=3363959 RepID=UPI003787D449
MTEPVATPVAASAAEPVATPVTETDDELERIEGIGIAMANALRAAGIRTFAQLAAVDDATKLSAIKAAGLSFAPSLTTWSRQAQLLADGDEAGFQVLTERLIAGRPEKPAADATPQTAPARPSTSTGKPGRTDRSAGSDRNDRIDRSAGSDRSTGPDRSGTSTGPGRSGRSADTDRTGRTPATNDAPRTDETVETGATDPAVSAAPVSAPAQQDTTAGSVR